MWALEGNGGGKVLTSELRLARIISGGQTGVDRTALMVAREYGYAIGGWCPPGRIAEDGAIPDDFPLTETPDDASPDTPDVPRSQRTQWNVRDSEGTLILTMQGVTCAGTQATLMFAEQYGCPVCLVVLDADDALKIARSWLERVDPQTLNVAGPSETSAPGIGALAGDLLRAVLPHRR